MTKEEKCDIIIIEKENGGDLNGEKNPDKRRISGGYPKRERTPKTDRQGARDETCPN